MADSDVPQIWIKPYFPAFNGVRAIAVALVFLMHFGQFFLPAKLIAPMWMGVDLFFVLSGFLITGILYDSLHDPCFFRNFYIRRALRIFPIFYGFFLIVFLLTPILHLQWERGLIAFCFYIGNFTTPRLLMGHHNPTVITWPGHFRVNVGHLWSLCVEEQFYLCWPAVIWVVRSRVRLMQLCAVGSVLILLLRLVLVHIGHDGQVVWGTFTRGDTMLIGGWFALWLRGCALSAKHLRRLGFGLMGLAAAASIPGFLLYPTASQSSPFIRGAGFSLIALACMGIVLLALEESSPLSRFLQHRMLTSFGAISYGFYFFHGFFVQAAGNLMVRHGLGRVAGAVLTIAVFSITLGFAKLSFHFYESKFLSLKSKWAPQWTPARSQETAVLLHLSVPRPKRNTWPSARANLEVESGGKTASDFSARRCR